MRITRQQFDTFYNSTPLVTNEQLVTMLQQRYPSWSHDYCVLILGTTIHEGYPQDPYLLYAWCCAMIGKRIPSMAGYWGAPFATDEAAWNTIDGWDFNQGYYSRQAVYYQFNNPYPEALKACYLAITNTDTNIFACSGNYYADTCYSVYHSPIYTDIYVWYVNGRPIDDGTPIVTRRTKTPSGEYNPCYMTNLYGASWSNNWNTCIYGNPTSIGANVLANCTGYAQGRALEMYNEITGYNPATTSTHPFNMFNRNAGEWYGIAPSYNFNVSQNPEVGAIMCWGDSLDAGHVAVVEAVVSNDEVITTESAWGGWGFGGDWCEMTRYRNSNGNFSGTKWNMPSNYYFQGFIINPANMGGSVIPPDVPVDPYPPYPPTPEEKRKKQWYLKRQDLLPKNRWKYI